MGDAKHCRNCGAIHDTDYKNCADCRRSWREDKRVARQSYLHQLESALRLIRDEADHACKNGETLRPAWLRDFANESLKEPTK